MDLKLDFPLGKENTMNLCFLCAESTRIRIAGSKVENSVDGGDESWSKIKPPVSLLCLLRHLKIKSPSSVQVKVEADLCNDCEWVVNRFSVLFQQCQNLQQENECGDEKHSSDLFVKLQTEMDFYLEKIFHRISNGAGNCNFLERYSTAMTKDPESASQLDWIDKLRKEIFEKCSKIHPSSNPTVDPSTTQTKISNDRVQKSAEMEVAGADESRKGSSTPLPETSARTEEIFSQNKSKSRRGSNSPKKYFRDSSTGRFCCTICDKSFRSKSCVNPHYNAIHLQQRWKCDMCNTLFNRRCNLVKHKKICRQLLERRLARENLRRIFSIDIETDRIICPCGKSFSTVFTANRHYNRIHQQKIFKMPQVRHSSPINSNISKSSSVSNQKYFKDLSTGRFCCTACDKSFRSQCSIYPHYNAVHLQQRWKCDICSLVFTRSCNLLRHKKICRELLERKLTKEKLQAIYKFECSACEKRFPLRNKLRRHQRTVHPASRMFKCEPCKKAYKTFSALREHNERNHLKGTWKGK